MTKKEIFLNWILVIFLIAIFALNYSYLFSEKNKKELKIQDYQNDLQNLENINAELIEEILKLRRRIEDKNE
jgi:hypothetical protein